MLSSNLHVWTLRSIHEYVLCKRRFRSRARWNLAVPWAPWASNEFDSSSNECRTERNALH